MMSMMVSFMRYCTNMLNQRTEDRGRRTDRCKALVFFLILSSVFCSLSSAHADGIMVHRAEARFSDGSYQLSANFDISFNFVIDQALTRGVSLNFVAEFTLTRPRWYWLDEVIAHSEQTAKLSYNTLTRQYRITRGSLYQNFSSLEDALRIIGRQSAEPIPASLLRSDSYYIQYLRELLPKDDSDYIAAARMRLDVSQLPKPLQVNALTTEGWNLDSGWYRWIVQPTAAISAADGEKE